jgi:hypothetical protein
MKTITLKSMLLICGMMTFSCSQSPSEHEKSANLEAKETSCGSVRTPLAIAKSWVLNYDTIWSRHYGPGSPPIKAYTIRSKDLLEVLGLPVSTVCKFDHVRAYIGLDNENNFKLFFTPVVGADLCNGIGGRDTLLTGAPGDPSSAYVLDLNTPCPQICGTNNIFEIVKSNDAK